MSENFAGGKPINAPINAPLAAPQETRAPQSAYSYAPLKNVIAFVELVTLIANRTPSLPNLGVLYGHSGLGKSFATIYAQNMLGAVRVEVGDSWNRKTFVEAVLLEAEAGKIKGSIADLMNEAIMVLNEKRLPLFIDEADKLVDKGMIELVRELAEKSRVPVLLIGEERLPQKLARFERVHNRVLDWCGANPCDLEDCRMLAAMYLEKVAIDDALLEIVRVKAEGRARRIVVTLANMGEWARNCGVRELNPQSYKGQFFNGETPRPRSGRLEIRRARIGGGDGTAV